MANKGRALVVLGALGLGGLAIWAAARKAEAAPPSSNFTLRIYDAEGNLVATNELPIGGLAAGGIGAFPGSLVEGGTGYTVVASVTNTSRYPDGTLAPFTFTVIVAAGVNSGGYFINALAKTLSLGAGATGSVSYPFGIPYGMNGPGSAMAQLVGSAGNVLASASATFTVTPVAITPSGTITF